MIYKADRHYVNAVYKLLSPRCEAYLPNTSLAIVASCMFDVPS